MSRRANRWTHDPREDPKNQREDPLEAGGPSREDRAKRLGRSHAGRRVESPAIQKVRAGGLISLGPSQQIVVHQHPGVSIQSRTLGLIASVEAPETEDLSLGIGQRVRVLPGVIERNQAPIEDYSKRRGYDPGFLEVGVPVPKLTKAQLAAAALPKGEARTAEGTVLSYFHFALAQNADRRMPIFTAVNIDGGRARSINRQTGEVEATEKWYQDPRLEPEDQLEQSVFEKQRPRIFDRGHMVRRLDLAWGSAAMAQKASDDTFHFTNCSLQISEFNQRARLWAGIENYVLDNAKAEKQRICVFTGPIFRDDDPTYRDVAVPQEFWKILIRVDAGQLRCTGFLADQGELLKRALQQEGAEAFDDLGPIAVFQSRISAVEEETGLDFGELESHDTAALARIEIHSLDEVGW